MSLERKIDAMLGAHHARGKKHVPKKNTPRAVRYIASFQPQAWMNDYAIGVDPEGEIDWDATAFIKTLSAEKQAEIAKATRDDSWMDDDDALMRDPRRPRWIKDWHGPFTITVTRSDR